jgi:hypothetical protein
MDVCITILVENTTPVPGLLGEYGFSAIIRWTGIPGAMRLLRKRNEKTSLSFLALGILLATGAMLWRGSLLRMGKWLNY